MRDDNPTDVNKKERFSLTVEPIIMVYALSVSANGNVMSDLFVRQTCASRGYNVTECLSNSTTEDGVLSAAAFYVSATIYLYAIVPSFLSIYIGGWSENNGRKKFLVIALIGQTVCWLTYAVLASMENLSPQYLLLPAVVNVLTGGLSVIQVLCNCILSDVTTNSNRSSRMALVVGSSCAGTVIGMLAAAWLFNDGTYFGYISVYLFIAVMSALAMLYAIFLLKESVRTVESTNRKLFDTKYLIDYYQVLAKKRQNRERLVVFLLFFFVLLNSLYYNGEGFIMYLSAKKMFKWDVGTFNYFGVVLYTYRTLITFVVVWLMTSYYKVKDLPFLAGVLVFLCGATATVANITNLTMFYASYALSSCIPIPTAIVKSLITKTVDSSEVGSAMALVTFLETVGFPLATSLYTATFSLVESTSPFMVNYNSTILSFLGFIVICLVFRIRKN